MSPPRRPGGNGDAAGPKRETEEYMDVSRIHAAIMREKDEPSDGYEPVPSLWLVVVMALAMWGGWYLGTYNMGFAADHLEGAAVATAAAPTAPPAVDPLVLGKRVFNNCMACHQASGNGIAGQFPPLAGSEWVQGDSTTLIRILLHGLEGPMQVLGKAYNGAMPAWGSKLSDAQIAAVLTFIRSSWGNSAAAIDPTTVAEVRRAAGKRTAVWSAPELQAAARAPK